MSVSDRRWADLGLSDQERRLIISVCTKFVNRRDELEDVLQNALVALALAFADHELKNKPIYNRGSFINRVVRNHMIYRYIQKGHKDLIYQSVNSSSLVENDEIDNFQLVASGHADSTVREARFSPLRRLLITEALNQLSMRERTILAYHSEDELTQADIAARMGLCQPTISNTIKRIKRKLQAALADT